MKKITTTLVILLFLITQILIGQTEQQDEQQKEIEKTLWRFTKMVIIADAMISEAYQTNNYEFVTLSMQYLDYAQNNLINLYGKIDPPLQEEGKEILGFLLKIAPHGLELNVGALTAKKIGSYRIERFAKSIFCKENN